MKSIVRFSLTKKISNQIAALNRALLSLLLVAFSAHSTADDLEIYDGLISGTNIIHPGVLFILDSSGSMGSSISPGGPLKKHVLEDTMVELLEGIVGSDTKIGLSRYNGGHGGPISYPVTRIGDLAKTLPGKDRLRAGPGQSFAEQSFDYKNGDEVVNLVDPRDDYWDENPGGTTGHLPKNPSGNITTQRGGQYYAAFYNLPLARNSEVVSAKLLVSIEDEASNDNPTGADLDKPDGTPVKNYFSQGKAKVKILRSVNPPRLPTEQGSYKTALRDYYAQQFGSTGSGVIEDSTIAPAIIRDAVIFDKKLWVSIDIEPALLMELIDTPPSADPAVPTPLWRMRNYHTTPPYVVGAGNRPANGALFQVTFETPFKLKSNPSKALELGNHSSFFPLQDAPQLHLQYDKSVRQRLIEMTARRSPFNSVEGSGGTPILESLIESLSYWRGGNVDYGRRRGTAHSGFHHTSRVSHPGALIFPGAHSLASATGCRVDNYNTTACSRELLINTRYVSPIQACNNTQVLLTDGAPSFNSATARNSVDRLLANAKRPACVRRANTQQKCIAELAGYMSNVDLDRRNAGAQTVNTSVIAFGNVRAARNLLSETAKKGKGLFLEANDAAKLLAALQATLKASTVRPSSVSASSIVVDAQNSLQTRSELYLTQFQPASTLSWEGNIKKYLLCVDAAMPGCTGNEGKVVDANGRPVYKVISGDFKIRSGIQSLWSATADVEVTEGGTGAKLRDAASRQLYIGNATDNLHFSYNDPANWNDSALSATRTAVCGADETNASSPEGVICRELMQGLLSNQSPGITPAPSSARWMHRDVVHSAPASIYYGNTSTGDPIYKVLYGTNDGILHFVSDDSGEEEWGFLPDRFLRQQASVINGTSNTGSATEHTYGFDLTPTVLIYNPDGGAIKKSDSDSVWAFVGLRRGGSALYAFDLTGSTPLQNQTDSVVPGTPWVINGAIPSIASSVRHSVTIGFERLGLTFSQPTPAKMMADGRLSDVLVFGGGYDPKLDDISEIPSANKPALGNAVYIVNAYTRQLLYSFSSGDDSKMIHSVPSAIAVIDSDGNGVDDRLYFGDTGGQVWRIDVGKLSALRPAVAHHALLASLSGSGNTDRRRFFEPPIVVPVKDARYSTKSVYDYILIGSGNRARPVGDSATIDHFYAIRDYQTGQLDPTAYPTKNNSQSAGSITTTDLVDITSATFVDATSGGDSTEGTAAKNKDGWYFTMDSTEKVLSSATVSPITVAGVAHAVLHVTSYVPPAPRASSCAAVSVGSSNERSFDLMSTQAVIIDRTGKASLKPAGNRKTVIGSGLIPGSTGTPQSTKKIGRLLPGATGVQNVQTKPITRTYWYSD